MYAYFLSNLALRLISIRCFLFALIARYARHRGDQQRGSGGGKNTNKDGAGPARGEFQKGGKGGRGGDGRDDAPGKNASSGGKGDKNDDEGWSRGDSSVSPLIPPFMRKLFMALPRHMGPQPDAEGLLKALRERALPDKPR